MTEPESATNQPAAKLDQTAPAASGIQLRLLAAIVAICCGVAATVVAIILIRGVLA
jgi:hypothetical protein